MFSYSSAGKIKYFLPIILLSLIFSSGYCNSIQEAVSVKNQQKDTTRLKDTLKSQRNDTLTLQRKDSLTLQGKDTLKISGKDSLTVLLKDSTKVQLPDSIVYKKTSFTGEELIRGERLFYGLAYTNDKAINCSGCHNTHESDTLNWNPDAIEISGKYIGKNAFELSKVLLRPTGKKMLEVHKGFKLTAEDIVLMKAFMDKLPETGLMKSKPVITYLLLLIIASILFLVSTTDLIIKKIFTNPRVNWLILLITGTFITYVLAVNAIAFGRATGYSPAQPVKFSHAVHAGQNQIDCNYCHYSAKISKSSGIPSGSICMNCHFLVRTGTRSGVTEIAKVLNAFDNKRPVEWIRIYKLPDFVFFSHAQHVTAGAVKCEECHGNVKEMDRLYQEPDLSMGWCLKCHDTKKINMGSEYYKTYYSELYKSFKAGKTDSLSVTDIGGRNCGKCHY